MNQGLLSEDYLGRSLLFGSGGGLPSILDWSAYTTNYDWTGTATSTPATSYGTFLNITGEGYLLFARGSTNSLAKNPDVRITVDGVVYVFIGVNAGNSLQGNLLQQPIYYASSLKIEVYNRHTAALNMGCDYTYLSKISSPSKVQKLLSVSSRKMAYATNATTTNADVINIIGSGYVLSIDFSGFYSSDLTAVVSGSLTVDSVLKMNQRNVFSAGQEAFKQQTFVGPIRFSSNFKVQHLANIAGITAATRVWYALD